MGLRRSDFVWALLALVLSLLTFGATALIILNIHLAAFTAGFVALFLYYGKQASDSTYGSLHATLQPASRGIEAVIGSLSAKQQRNLDKRLTGANVIDEVLQTMIEYIFRDYVHSWYRELSSDGHFPMELRETMHSLIITFASHAKSINWVPYITGELVNEVASHIKLYRQAEEAVKKESKSSGGAPDDKFREKLESKFFDLETKMEDNICRDLICTTDHDRKQYLQSLSEALLYLLLPPSSFDCRIVRYLAREVIVNAISCPTVELITDPDYVNQCIIHMMDDSTFNRDSFLAAVKISDSVEELTAVLDKIDHETTLHRAQDKGGVNDSNVKQVLSSLNYVKKLTAARLEMLKCHSGDDQLDAAEMEEPGVETVDASSDMSLQALLSSAVGVQYFNDYLITHDHEMYLNFLLDIECCIKVATEQSQLSASGCVTIAEDKELTDMCQDIYSKYTSPEVLNRMKLGQSLIPTFKEMAQSPKPSVEVFESLHAQVFERLELIYEDFKKDRQYQRLLRELKLTSDAAAFEATSGCTDEVDSSSGPDDRRSSIAVIEDVCSLNAVITMTDTVKDKDKPYTLYVIDVVQACDGNPSQHWQTKRRYREFDEFRTLLSSKYAGVSNIAFPGKKPFNNMNKEFLERRTLGLNFYLQTLFKIEKDGNHPGLLDDLLLFLQPDGWSKERHAVRLPGKGENTTFFLSAAVRIPTAGARASADVIFGDFLHGVGKVFKGGVSGLTGKESSLLLSSSKDKVGASLDLTGNDDESIPLRIMLLLFDEVFDLRRKNQWFRRRIVAILRQVVKTTLGDSINRRIVEHVDDMLSAERIAEYLRMLRDALWPGGYPAESKTPRDAACRQRTRIVCKAKMLDTVADEVRHFIGSDATNRGVLVVFSMFQYQSLNRRLLFVIVEGVLKTLFPGNAFEKVFREMHSRSKRVSREASSSSVTSSAGLYSTGLG